MSNIVIADLPLLKDILFFDTYIYAYIIVTSSTFFADDKIFSICTTPRTIVVHFNETIKTIIKVYKAISDSLEKLQNN